VSRPCGHLSREVVVRWQPHMKLSMLESGCLLAVETHGHHQALYIPSESALAGLC